MLPSEMKIQEGRDVSEHTEVESVSWHTASGRGVEQNDLNGAMKIIHVHCAKHSAG